jgi:hypothetical protein
MSGEAPVDNLNLRASTGQETVGFRLSRFGGNSGMVDLDIEPDYPLDVGYESAFARLDRQSLGRLLHWLQTGEALPRDDARIPDVFGGAR